VTGHEPGGAVRLGLVPDPGRRAGDAIAVDPLDPLDAVADEVRRLTASRPLDVATVLSWARDAAPAVPLPGGGDTRGRLEWLATVAAADLTLARVAEPHLDAVAILAEADVRTDEGATWGVWAAEGPSVGLRASTDGAALRLDGTKPWCSLAGLVSHALVTAWRDDGRRGLYTVDLSAPGVAVDAGRWAPSGLTEVVTATVTMDGVRAVPVGGPGWYLDRPGFAWGGVGVAAVWYGGAVGLARRLAVSAARREPDQVALVHLGAVDAALAAAAAVLGAAAEVADRTAGGPAPAEAARVAARSRQVAADAAEQVLTRAGHALGPGPLAHEPEHARRVADLGLYVRQHHAERDQAALGRLVLDGTPW